MKSILALLLAASAGAQTLPDQYIVELSNEPVVKLAARLHKRVLRGDVALSAHRAAIREEQRQVRSNIESSDAQVLDSFDTVHNALVVKMSKSKADEVRNMAGVKSVRAVKVYHALLDRSLPLQKVSDAWQQIGGIDKAGLGVKIAIIDTGIDASHPAFQDPNLTMPGGFPLTNASSDLAFTNTKIIVARAYTNPSTRRIYDAHDKQGHGTGVAMVAAGVTNNGKYGPITGVAPKAWLGNYKVFPDDTTGAPDSLIIRAIEDAVNDGMDVINLSLGSFPATRPSDDSLVRVLENAVAAGKVVVVAAGNDGAVPNTIASPATAPSVIAVGSSWNDRIFASRVLVDGRDPFIALPGDGKNPDTPIGATLKDVSSLDATGLACSALPAASLSGNIALILRGTCNFSVKLTNALNAGAVAAVVYARPESPDPIPMATGAIALPAVMVSNADGLALSSAAAGGDLTASVDFSAAPVTVNSARLSDYSSRGPNSDSGIKPDLLAIGQNLSTAQPVAAGSYVVESGTSFSSPTVAGAAALLIAARPGLTGQQYRSLLVNSTSAFSVDGKSDLAVQYGGTGLLNMTAALGNATTVSPASLSFGIGGGSVNWTQNLTITNAGTLADTFALSIQQAADGAAPSLSTNTLQLDPGQSQSVGVQFAADQLGGGVYQGFVQIQGTQSAIAGRVPYFFAVPTQVPVYIQILDAPTTVRRGNTFDIEFRVLDASGVPVSDGVNTSILSGATALGVQSSDSDVPGSYLMHIQAPLTRGSLALEFKLGDASGTPDAITVN